MFGFFKTAPFVDAQLGELQRKRGAWRGSIRLDSSAPVLLVLSGGRAAPDEEVLGIARSIPANYASWRPVIERELFEHYTPLADSITTGELDAPAGLPVITAPASVWPHVTVEFVQVTPLDGTLTVEIGYRVAWDEEHTLGARVRDGVLLELCGSVLQP